MSQLNHIARRLSVVAACLLTLTSVPALADPDEDMMILANAAYDDEEYQDAFDIWKPLADKGNMQAQMELAHAFEHCNCVAKGDDLAVDYYYMAGKKGNLAAIRQIGYIFRYKKRDKAEAAKYYKTAADLGDAESQIELGDLYQSGVGGAATLTQAPKYYLMAAAQGDKAGYSRLGYLYENAKLVPLDPVRAYAAYAVAGKLFFPMAKDNAAKAKAKLTAKQLVAGDVLIAKCEKAKFLKCL
jgi:uncharacterized protein